MRQAEEARYELEAAKAELTELELNLRSQELDQKRPSRRRAPLTKERGCKLKPNARPASSPC